MTKQLHYFDSHGLGEIIRYILHYGEVEYEEVDYAFEDWPKLKASTPFGQLPLYVDGDKGTLSQSLAIAKYVGQSLGLVAGDPFKDAHLDAMALTMNDLWGKCSAVYLSPNPEQKEIARKALMTEHKDFYMSRFDKQLSENGGFFVGKLTWVDFVLVGVVESANFFLDDMHIEAGYPAVQKLVATIHSYPGVKKYVDSRSPHKNPFKP